MHKFVIFYTAYDLFLQKKIVLSKEIFGILTSRKMEKRQNIKNTFCKLVLDFNLA